MDIGVQDINLTITVNPPSTLTITGVGGPKGDTGAIGLTGATGPSGPSDHTLLSNIGTNTHAQIDTALATSATHIANTANPHVVTKAQVGLSNVPNIDFTSAVAANTAKNSYPAGDATKLAGVATGATANSPDATLLARANHTGTQAQSTVTNLTTDLAAKLPVSGTTAGDIFIDYVGGKTDANVPFDLNMDVLGTLKNAGSTVSLVGHQHVATTDLTATGTKDATTYLRGDNTWATPAGGGGAVSSVNTRIGAVVLDKTDVGLANVDNTSDANKPVSTAQAAADALALPLAGGTMTGALTVNNTLASYTPTFKDSTDPTKALTINLSGISTGTTRSLSVPNTTGDTLVTRNFAETLTNKTLTNPVITGQRPVSDLTTNIGTTTLNYLNLYAQTLNLNSTASISGTVAGTSNVTGMLGILATSATATHSLTLGSTATGIAFYNTSDQTTNWERVRGSWNTNVYQLFTEASGTGTARNVRVGDSGGYLDFAPAASSGGAKFTYTRTSSTSGSLFNVTTTGASLTGGAGVTQYGIKISPTYSQTSTASGIDLLIDRTETGIGSGTQALIDARVSGVSKFKVSNLGHITAGAATTAGASLNIPTGAVPTTPATGDIYSDGTNIFCYLASTWKQLS